MAPPKAIRSFPALKTYMRLNSLNSRFEHVQFFDVEFYPFTEPGHDPVFAVVGGSEAIVCRPNQNEIETIAWFRDEDPKTVFNSCCWSVDYKTGDPLLVVAGSRPVISVFNVRTRERLFGLAGHGKAINALATSPLAPNVLASASFDKTVRIWSLDPDHRKQPCMVICGGEGHKEGLQTMAFHQSGRFLLTGGFDNMINCWVIPELPSADAGSDRVTTIHYPHFSSMAIHTDFVDCVAWHGDLILSKCAREEKIVLWRIENFDSSEPLRDPFPAPTTYEFHPTRSAWGGSFQRLLEFEVPEASLSWIRFEIFPGLDPSENTNELGTRHGSGTEVQKKDAITGSYTWSNWSTRPLLAVGNTKSKVVFWDLQALEGWVPSEIGSSGVTRGPGRKKRGGARGLGSRRGGLSSRNPPHRSKDQELPRKDGGAAGLGEAPTDASQVRDEHIETPLKVTAESSLRESNASAERPSSSLGPTNNGSNNVDDMMKPQEARGGERLFGTSEPFQPLRAHAHAIVPKVAFCVRQVSWSQGGEWMVAVGDQGMVALFGR